MPTPEVLSVAEETPKFPESGKATQEFECLPYIKKEDTKGENKTVKQPRDMPQSDWEKLFAHGYLARA